MRSPASSPRMVKWAIFLSQYNIDIRLRPAIKGQALADFVTECTARSTIDTSLSRKNRPELRHEYGVFDRTGTSLSRKNRPELRYSEIARENEPGLRGFIAPPPPHPGLDQKPGP
ncbi:unnamed protein product, partial [Cuscuta europaea]